MEIMRCKNGHSYDPSITPECPECAKMNIPNWNVAGAMGGETVPLDGRNNGMNMNGMGDVSVGKTEPIYNNNQEYNGYYNGMGSPNGGFIDKTEPVNVNNGMHWADANNYRETNYASESYAPTMPVNFQKNEKERGAVLPVTGWLVCIDGPSKGLDYRIHEEYNYIGRSSKMDICIQGDPTISRENHAIIAYDGQERMFYFAPSGGGSIVRVNGKAVLGNVELKAYDKLSIGQSVFIFIPFCGEQFEWK